VVHTGIKGSIAPGLSQQLVVQFTGRQLKYHYDCIRVHTQVRVRGVHNMYTAAKCFVLHLVSAHKQAVHTTFPSDPFEVAVVPGFHCPLACTAGGRLADSSTCLSTRQ
jgi:hypothetical protein